MIGGIESKEFSKYFLSKRRICVYINNNAKAAIGWAVCIVGGSYAVKR